MTMKSGSQTAKKETEKKVGEECHHRFHLPATGFVRQERVGHRPIAGIEEGVAEGCGIIRHAHADVLHQPRREEPERVSQA